MARRHRTVRLIKKFAEMIDGIDLSRARAGEVLRLSPQEARTLIAEGWAEPVPGTPAVAEDKPSRRRREQAANQTRRAPRAPRRFATAPPPRGPTVLVVEDDPALLTFYRNALRMAAYEVLTATDGLDALQRLESQRPDVVILDLGLPLLSGREVGRELAARAATREIPVVLVTGDTGAVDERDFARVLRKPIVEEALIEAVSECFHGRLGAQV